MWGEDKTVIKSFRHKGLRQFVEGRSTKSIPSELRKRIQQILARLEFATKPEDMSTTPGRRWHPYKGKRQGTFGVDVNGPWRITYRWENGHAIDVNLEQEH